ncbi:hypothetical protein KAT24_02150 [Candidatus Pacearchaeota archaeon]|nr:hypothetical protein [Candidatus Pacearchaeota archaeon]
MLDRLITKLLGESNIKIKISQVNYEISKAMGEVELLVTLVKDEKEIEKAKEELPLHLERYNNLSQINKAFQISNPKEGYLIEFNNKFSNLLKEYGEKIEQLRNLI